MAPDVKSGARKRGEPANAPDVVHEPADTVPMSGPSLLSTSGDCSPLDSNGHRQATNEFPPGNGLIWISEKDPSRYSPHLSTRRECDDPPAATEPQESLVSEEEPLVFLDEAPQDVEQALSSLGHSQTSEGGDAAAPLAPALSSPWYREDTPNPPKRPGPLSLQESCLIRCFTNKLAVHVSHGDHNNQH